MYFETPKKNRKNRSISKPKPLQQQQSTSLEKKGQKDKENNYANLKNGGVMNNHNHNANSQNNSKKKYNSLNFLFRRKWTNNSKRGLSF